MDLVYFPFDASFSSIFLDKLNILTASLTHGVKFSQLDAYWLLSFYIFLILFWILSYSNSYFCLKSRSPSSFVCILFNLFELKKYKIIRIKSNWGSKQYGQQKQVRKYKKAMLNNCLNELKIMKDNKGNGYK